MPDARDASVADGERRRHAVTRVHRQEAAVDQVYVRGGAARGMAAIVIAIVVPIVVIVVIAPARAGGERNRRGGDGALDETSARKPPALFICAHVLSFR
jgi:hypothetical protein